MPIAFLFSFLRSNRNAEQFGPLIFTTERTEIYQSRREWMKMLWNDLMLWNDEITCYEIDTFWFATASLSCSNLKGNVDYCFVHIFLCHNISFFSSGRCIFLYVRRGQGGPSFDLVYDHIIETRINESFHWIIVVFAKIYLFHPQLGNLRHRHSRRGRLLIQFINPPRVHNSLFINLFRLFSRLCLVPSTTTSGYEIMPHIPQTIISNPIGVNKYGQTENQIKLFN